MREAAKKELRGKSGWLHLIAGSAVALCAFACPPAALAQQVAVIVNGDPITTYDIQQRSKLIQLQTHKTPSHDEVLNDLIDDKLKVQIGKRYRLEMSDAELETAYGEMAGRMRLNAAQLTQTLANQGVAAYTMKDRLRAQTVWQQIVRGKFQASLQLNEKEIEQKLEVRNQDDAVGYDYTLQPILFVIPRGSSDEAASIKKRDAEALRARFDNCNSGLAIARGLRDVAVRQPITKNSADLPPALREILDKTPVGKLTEPEVTAEGVQVFALCNKRETKAVSAAKREVQNELYAEQFTAKSKRLLAELRKQAMIEYKEVHRDREASDAKPTRRHTR
jgi:peptidyl-prolyl cis-trans isomerase SurA